MVLGPAHGDTDQLRALVGEHLAVIGVIVAVAASLLRFGAAFSVGIGDGDDFDVLAVIEYNIQPVTVITVLRMPNNSGAVIGRGSEQGRGCGQSDCGGGNKAAAGNWSIHRPIEAGKLLATRRFRAIIKFLVGANVAQW